MIRYHAEWVLPVATPPIPDGTVVEHEGRIAYVGPRAGAPAGDDVELGESILLPGLVNAHCHLELTAMRGFLDGLGFREWVLRLTFARRAVLSDEMLLDAARLGVEEGLRAGITTFGDTGDTGAGFSAMLEAGVRGICYREVFGPAPAQCAESLLALRDKVTGMRERETSLVRVGVSPHAPYTVSDELFVATAALARELGTPMAIHIAESALESELVERGAGAFADGLRARGMQAPVRGSSPVELLERLGVLRARPLLIHCVRVDERDIGRIARNGCAVAHCPASNAKLGHGVAPLANLLGASIRVGLGTDSVASNDRMDVLDEARLASLMSGARERRVDALSTSAAIELATIGGARALGLDAEIGTLEAGKSADLAAFPIPSYRRPVHDPVAALLFAMPGTAAALVTVAGRALVRDGRVLEAVAGVAGRVQQSAALLSKWLDTPEGGAAPPTAPSPRR